MYTYSISFLLFFCTNNRLVLFMKRIIGVRLSNMQRAIIFLAIFKVDIDAKRIKIHDNGSSFDVGETLIYSADE